MVRLSKLYNSDIYTIDAQYLGKVSDILLDLEAGEVVRITTAPLKTNNKTKIKQILKDKSIPYNAVVSVKDIIIVSLGKSKEATPAEEQAAIQYNRLR